MDGALVVGTETLVAADHVTIYQSKTAGWVGTQVHSVERSIKYPTLPADFSTTQTLGGHVTSRKKDLCSNDQGRQRRETLGTRLRETLRTKLHKNRIAKRKLAV